MSQAMLDNLKNERRIWSFPGGLHMPDHKEAALGEPIGTAPVPKRLILPLAQHIGAPATPVVEVGDRVLKGQTIAEAEGYVSAPIHASSSGTVVSIGPQPIAHPSGLETDCIVIETDGKDEPLAEPEWEPTPNYSQLEAAEIRQIVRKAGITGLGGASFPSYIKLNPGTAKRIETLILNGAECEPYIACDQALMAERAGEIIAGAKLIQFAVGAPECLIGVEDNKPRAIQALRAVAADETGIEVVVLPTKYPQGGEKQLIQALTGKQVPSEGLPLDVGIVCHNVATAAAVWRAIAHAEPLISRVMSITGNGVAQQRNLQVRIGTPVAELIEYCGGYTEVGRLIMGGPMMGFALKSDTVPVVKATNCILAVPASEMKPEEPAMPCIRCGECADACPASLLPQQLYWYARDKDFEATQDYNLFDCIECGICAQVCPSHIPLVHYYRYAKTEIWQAERERQQSDIARQRHEARKERQEREAAEAEARRAEKRRAVKEGAQGEIADAIARAKAKKEDKKAEQQDVAKPEAGGVAADIIARAKAKSAGNTDTAADSQPQSAAAQAIARAKAKSTGDDKPAEEPKPQSPAAAAIARAKAKAGTDGAPEPRDSGADKPQSAAAAAIAKAKAKGEASGDENGSDDAKDAQAPGDSKLSPAQQAIARAKQKASGEAAERVSEEQADLSATAEASGIVAEAIDRARKARTEPNRATLKPGEVPSRPYYYDSSTETAPDPVADAIRAAKERRQPANRSGGNLAPGELPAANADKEVEGS